MPKLEVYRQAPPFCMQVELVEGCQLRCSFCGLNGIRGKENNFKFADIDMLHVLANRMVEEDWTPRIEFAMHGEPSQHPQLVECVQLFRNVLPKKAHLMMTSNGAGFMKDVSLIDEVLKYLNVLALDWYENVQIVPKILEKYAGSHTPRFYPKEQDANPHHRRKPKAHDFVVIQDIKSATKGTHASLNNHCGAGAPKDESANGKRCAKPFREISIRWDGSIAVCCNDWRGEYKCGNVKDQSLEEIWQGPAFVAARKKLYHGMRDFGSCEGCNALSYRPGLLPDQKGLASMSPPNARDLQAIEQALAGPPLTLPVLRPWEVT